MSGIGRLEQKWNMFSKPLSEDGWYECSGILRGGSELDLMGWGGPVPRKIRYNEVSFQFQKRLIIISLILIKKKLSRVSTLNFFFSFQK